MSYDVTNQNISDTFQNILQRTGSGLGLYDLNGRVIDLLNLSGSLNISASKGISLGGVTRTTWPVSAAGEWSLVGAAQTSSLNITVNGLISGSSLTIDNGSSISGFSNITGSLVISGASAYGDASLTLIPTSSYAYGLLVSGSTYNGIPLGLIQGASGEMIYGKTTGSSNNDVFRIRQGGGGSGTFELYNSASDGGQHIGHAFYDPHQSANSYVCYSNHSQSDAYFGIGTNNPTTHLHVSGNIKGDGDLFLKGQVYDGNDQARLSVGITSVFKSNVSASGDGFFGKLIVGESGTNSASADYNLTVKGSISSSGEISTESHITASGNISSSGNLYANLGAFDTNLNVGAKIVHKGDTNTYLQFQSDEIELYAGGTETISVIPSGVNITGNITASGDISSSGTIYATDLNLSGNTGFVTNSQTGSFLVNSDTGSMGNLTVNGTGSFNRVMVNGDISASGNVYTEGYVSASSGFFTGTTTGTYVSASNSGVLDISGSGRASLDVLGDISASGHISASGNISSSGNIIATGYITAHTQLYSPWILCGTTGFWNLGEGRYTGLQKFGGNNSSPSTPIVSSGSIYARGSGSNFAGGHITASGNISSSYASTGSFGSMRLSNLPSSPTGLPSGSFYTLSGSQLGMSSSYDGNLTKIVLIK